MRAKNNQPIFGILTQPLPEEWMTRFPHFRQNNYTSYFESSHADYLHSAGARTVHIDYRTPMRELEKELAQINGLYIPGDGRTTLLDKEYMQTVSHLLSWAQGHNTEKSSHFPVVATSYGYLNMLRG